ncbi:hypothetical protein RHMOL_Rhmol03G0154300 [Rhododendron molle]|uniref:Uncharacterized protein n=1 Tax=Rhododendron molle TaxID=49168 RepID=A0ACC0PFW2_RHOML|nr:hypothetical protein RHMOL_Rhmol03G0154300 [Rhododendron molle]
MRAIQGALIVASTLQIVLGFGGLWRNVTRCLSPFLAVPLVALVGFGLYEFGFPGVGVLILNLDTFWIHGCYSLCVFVLVVEVWFMRIDELADDPNASHIAPTA